MRDRLAVRLLAAVLEIHMRRVEVARQAGEIDDVRLGHRAARRHKRRTDIEIFEILSVNPQIYKKLSYQLSDFTPVTMLTSAPLILVVNPSNERTPSVRTLADLVSVARARPGELLYGPGGPGNITGLSFEMLGNQGGFKGTHVPYKGPVAAQIGLLGKEVDAILDTPPSVPHVKAGKLGALAVTGARRWRDLPDVPTIWSLLQACARPTNSVS